MIVIGILGAGGAPVLEIARRAAATGTRTEVVGAVPVGADGDRQLLQLATAAVGHATVTRVTASSIASADSVEEPRGPAIEPADLDLALRYLPEVRVIVLVQPSSALLATGAAAAAFAGAALILVGPIDPPAIDALGALAPIVLDPPAHHPDGAFAGLVAALAARLDAGEVPSAAWSSTLSALAIEPASGSSE